MSSLGNKEPLNETLKKNVARGSNSMEKCCTTKSDSNEVVFGALPEIIWCSATNGGELSLRKNIKT